MGWLDRIRLHRRGRIAERRRHPRYNALHQLECDMGEPVDLSLGGMRLIWDEKPPFLRGELVTFTIRGGGKTMLITGRVVRLRRERGMRYDVGIAFHNLSPQHARQLESIVRFGFAEAQEWFAQQRKRSAGTPRVTLTVTDYYQVLGVPRDADLETIRQAFRREAMRYHPDRNRNGDAARRFQQVHEAWAVLKDAAARREHDALLARAI